MFCDFQTSIEQEEISFPSSFQFWTNKCFANKLLKLLWMKKEKNRKQEIMNFSFFNRNYPSLFCYASFAFRFKIIYRKKHTMTKCLKRSLNALPQLFSQIFPNPLPQTLQKTTKYKTMPYRDFHAYYSFEIKIKTLLLLSLFIRKKMFIG